jgi:hypothetical protein
MREYNKTDAIDSMRREKKAAEDKQDFKTADAIKKRIEWLRSGCKGREPKLPIAKKQFNNRLAKEGQHGNARKHLYKNIRYTRTPLKTVGL